MTRPNITLACGRYDRVWPLVDGRVRPEGADLNVISLEPEELFFRMIKHAEFDAAEMSLASYVVAVAGGDTRFVGIPVFPSRSFRHNSLYVREDSPVREAADLAGLRIGVPEYQMTAAVWTRGLLQHDFGVDLDTITWRTGGLEQPGRGERQALTLPDRIRIDPVPGTLSQALVDGEIDALMAPRVPSVFRREGGGVRRVFPDYAERESEYYQRTGIFPIMHLVVVRADLAQAHPWLARSLYKAFEQAKSIALEGLADAPALRYSMPFLLDALERQQKIFGADPWPYGLTANRAALEVFAGYLAEQGLTADRVEVSDLFAPSTLVESKV
jgi:4,5-dihydroxyphthalate decarboxylase